MYGAYPMPPAQSPPTGDAGGDGGMWPLIAAGVAGSVVSGLAGVYSAKRQMDFQERMASSQHQREVADLRAAGLNPILSGTGGQGAAAPGGAGFQVPDLGHSALAARRMAAEIPVLEQQAKTGAAMEAEHSARARMFNTAAGLGERGAELVHKGGDAVEAILKEVANRVVGPLGDAVSSAKAGVANVRAEIERIINAGKNLPDDVVKALREMRDAPGKKIEEFLDAQREKVREHNRWIIPPATRKPGARRGTLGGANTWDYGPTR